MEMIDFDKMKELASHYGVSLDDVALSRLNQYASMLVEWNEKMNLTSIVNPDGIMVRHFEDSLSIFKFVSMPESSSVIDVGTGAGFPGLVLKIVRPDLRVTLLDSLNKRVVFLREVAVSLQLNVDTLHFRAEEASRKSEYREAFDFSCARAVSNLRILSEYCIPFVNRGGRFIAMKGPDVGDELNSAKAGIGTLGGKPASAFEYQLSDGSGRTLVVINKIASTPPQFPRSSAQISKKPL